LAGGGVAEEPGGFIVDSCEHEREDGAQLDKDVQGWSTSVLEWVTNGVTDNGSLVLI